MIEAQALPIEAFPGERSAALSALLAQRRHFAAQFAPAAAEPSRALVAIEEAPASDWAADLRFFATCYLAGFIFFLIMLT